MPPYDNEDYGAKNIEELGDVQITNLKNSDLLKYDGTQFSNFSPTYLDGDGIEDNSIIKVVGGVTTQTNMVETSVLNTSTSLQTYIPLDVFSVLAGTIETELYNTNKTRMHLTTNGISSTNGITVTSDGKVGIGVVDPQEDLELDGNIQLDTGGAQRGRVIFYDKQDDHEHAEIDGVGEGTNGGAFSIYTKVDNGSVTEKLRINNQGAIGIGGANYGSSGQVIVSNGSGSAVSWSDQTDTTYSAGTGISIDVSSNQIINTAPDQIVTLTQGGSTTITGTYPNFTISSTDTNTTYSAGTGVTINGSNQISIGQSVETSDSVTFNQVEVSNNLIVQGDANLNLISARYILRPNIIPNKPLTINGVPNWEAYRGDIQIGAYSEGAGGYQDNVRIDGYVCYLIGKNATTVETATGHVFIKAGQFGSVARNIYLEAYNNGDIYCTGAAVKLNGTALSSDDRIKHNEVNIFNGLDIVRKLNPQKYQKTDIMYDENFNGDISGVWRWESGLIAQEILNIDDLSYCVKGGDYIDNSGNTIIEKYYLNYNDIFVYNIAATKELDIIVQNLQAENALMKNALNQLLSDAGKATIP